MGAATLTAWLELGLSSPEHRRQALVRRWLREAREHRPIIDRGTAQ